MMKFLRHLFTPHYSNNQRARLLHNSSLFLVACLLLISAFGIGIIKTNDHAVLGISANISSQDLLTLTNQARNAAGLPSLNLDPELSQAAAGKAEDMFTNNYWAHISPSGITPWDFIRNAGYNYQYAGENLARGYTSAQDAMNAWMGSPEHKANILSPNYTDVGFAVAEGNLAGDSGTVLIVEEFGKRAGSTTQQNSLPVVQQAAAQEIAQTAPSPTSIPSPTITITPTPMHQTLTQVTEKPLVDSKKATQAIAITLLVILIVLLVMDMILMGRKKVFRIVGHNMDHIIFFVTVIIIAILLGQGVIF